jgi:hypothetical protein
MLSELFSYDLQPKYNIYLERNLFICKLSVTLVHISFTNKYFSPWHPKHLPTVTAEKTYLQ